MNILKQVGPFGLAFAFFYRQVGENGREGQRGPCDETKTSRLYWKHTQGAAARRLFWSLTRF